MTASITVAMRSALTGLQVNQTALGLTSTNIANAGTEGYTRKVAELRTLLVAGQGGGVEVAAITRQVSEFLLRDLRAQHSQLGAAQVLGRYYQNTQDIFGPPGSSASISATVTGLANAFQALAVEPASPAAQQDAVNAALTTTRQLNAMAASVQKLRMEVNREIADLVTRANTLIGHITELNAEISRNTALGKPVGDLADQRDRDVAELAGIMDISYFVRDNGQMVVFAGNGRTLVDTIPATLSYTPTSAMSADVSYPSGGIGTIAVNGTDITTNISSGKLKSLIDLRDTVLPGLGLQLDRLAETLRDQIDAIHNTGTAIPAPNALTGARAFANPAADQVDITGTVRIAVLDRDGRAVGVPMDLDLDDLAAVVGGTPTANDIVNAINGVHAGAVPPIPGLAGATASVDADGRLVIAADNAAHGIGINEGTSRETVTGFGFSHYFGLNNFFVSIPAGGAASNITVRADIVADPQFAVRGALSGDALGAGDTAIAIGDGSVVQQLAAAFQLTLDFGEAGGLSQTHATLSEYAASIVATNANAAARADSDLSYREVIFADIRARADSLSGVNIDEELGNLILYQNAYAANARMISVLSEVLKILSELA